LCFRNEGHICGLLVMVVSIGESMWPYCKSSVTDQCAQQRDRSAKRL
jgi:hypothetical protein